MSEEFKPQIHLLADWIMANVLGEPSKSEGAGETAIRIMTTQRERIERLQQQVEELTKERDEWHRDATSHLQALLGQWAGPIPEPKERP